MILPFSYQDLEVLALNLRPEQERILGFIDGLGIEVHEYGYQLESKAAINKDGNKIAWSAISEQTVEACSGITKLSPGVYEAWALFGKGFKKYSVPIARAIKSEVDNLEFDRLQAFTEADFLDGNRFLKFLGFKKEAELKSYYGKGKNAVVYSIIRE